MSTTMPSNLLAEVLAGLAARPRTLPCKLFYDELGSRLFERICDLPEYYLTRAELALLEHHAGDVAAAIGPRAVLLELGSGSGKKTRLLLENLHEPAAYVPIDLAPSMLELGARDIADRFAGLPVVPVLADFTGEITLPSALPAGRRTVYFPGSTIGNLDVHEADALFRRLAGIAEALVLAYDLKKEPARLHAAYNDAQGVTAAFNLNLLARLNREAGANFDLAAFDHYAPYDPLAGRVEMYLVSRQAQTVLLAGRAFELAVGEPIHTECCHKYSVEQMREIAAPCGWRLDRTWTDPDGLFALSYLERVDL